MAMVYWLAGILVLPLLLVAWRYGDHRADQKAMGHLAATQPPQPRPFTDDLVADLPEPARRYFQYVIEPGAPLYTVARLSMAGRFAMGDKARPRYLAMTATQMLASPQGFVWAMSAHQGLLRVSGSDSHRWTRFWLMNLLPVARMGGGADHRRSAFGRYVAEAVFWTPAALLPGTGVQWTGVDANSARVTVTHDGLSQSVDVRVAENGQPTCVSFQRWSNANAERKYRPQPFGGYLSDFRWFGGFRLPAHVEAGNLFGTDDYFPFFIADVSDVTYPDA